jgi:hypothetical protein
MQHQPQKCLELALDQHRAHVPDSGTPQIYPLWRYNSGWQSEDNAERMQKIGYEGGESIIDQEAFLIMPLGLLEGTGFAVLVPFDAIEGDRATTEVLRHALAGEGQSAAHRKTRLNLWKQWWMYHAPPYTPPKT